MKTNWTAGRYAAWIYLQYLLPFNYPDAGDTNNNIFLLINTLTRVQLIQASFNLRRNGFQPVKTLVKLCIMLFKEQLIVFKQPMIPSKEQQTTFKVLMTIIKFLKIIPKVVQVAFKQRMPLSNLLQTAFKVVITLIHLLIIGFKSRCISLNSRIIKLQPHRYSPVFATGKINN